MVPCTYRRIRFTALQCIVVGACRNWHTLFTAKEMSGLVSVRYYKAPTKLLYQDESSEPSLVPPSMLSFSVLGNGVSTGLHLCILDRDRMSEAYRS